MADETTRAAYTSTVLAPAQIALGVVSGLVVAAILIALDGTLWPVAIIVVLAFGAVGYYLATVSVTIEGSRITIGQGRGERDPRVVYIHEVRSHEVRQLSWPQCFGLGLHADDRTTRLTVRSGPTLFLTLVDGEQIRVSADDTDAAVRLIAPDTGGGPETGSAPETGGGPGTGGTTGRPRPRP